MGEKSILKKISVYVLVFLFALGAVLSGGSFLRTVEAASLLSDNFEAYTTFPSGGWTAAASSGAWTIAADGSKVAKNNVSSTGTYLLTNGTSTWSNYSFSARVKPGSVGSRHGLAFRYKDTSNYYTFILKDGSKAYLYKKVGGSETAVSYTNFTYNSSTFYTLKVTISGSAITCYINGSQVLSATDSSLTTGKVALYTFGNASFDDVAVEDSSSPTPTPTTTPPPSSSEELSVSSVTDSGNDGNVAANTIDNNLSTRWSSNGSGQWITYDLGTSASVSNVKVAWYQGDTRITTFDINVSDDNSIWNQVYTGQSRGNTLDYENYDFQDVNARYVKIIGYGNTTNTWNSITEVKIFGTPGSGTPPTPTPTPTPTPPPSGITYPAQLLDLTNWKETLPIGSSGSPTEIKQPALATYSISPWFTLNSAKTAVQFRANCGGVTTSGSSYPRSELREMTNSGTTNASWSTTSGTHRMYIKQAITHLPVVKPQVVAGQIHDASDDVTVFRLEGTNLYITDGDTTHAYLLTSNYTLGTVFTVEMVASGGKIEYYYNGSKVPYSQTKSVSGCYFKAGCYTQSNTSKGDDADAYGEVQIYELEVTHQ